MWTKIYWCAKYNYLSSKELKIEKQEESEKMRTISLANCLEFEFTGSVLRKGLTLGDVDNDGFNELVIGNIAGEVAIFKVSLSLLFLMIAKVFLSISTPSLCKH